VKAIKLKTNEEIILKEKNLVYLLCDGSCDLYGFEGDFSLYIANFEKNNLIFNSGFDKLKEKFTLKLKANSDTILKVFNLKQYFKSHKKIIIEEMALWAQKLLTVTEKDFINLKNVHITKKPITLKKQLSVEILEDVNLRKEHPLFWIKVTEGKIKFLNHVIDKNDPYLPCIEHSLLSTITNATVVFHSSEHIETLEKSLHFFHEIFLRNLTIEKEKRMTFYEQQKENYKYLEQHVIDLSEITLASVLDKKEELTAPTKDKLLKACQFAANKTNIILSTIDEKILNSYDDTYSQVKLIAEYSKVRFKRVQLKEGFWECEINPTVAFYSKHKTPVVLFFQNGKILMFDPDTKNTQHIDEKNAYLLENEGYVFYRNLPENNTKSELSHYMLDGNKKDITTIVMIGLLSTLLALYLPMAISWIFNYVIAFHSSETLIEILLGFFAMAFGTMLFTVTQLFAILRLQSNLGYNLQCALWGKLLSLKMSFFRNFTSGDLYQRVNAIDQIRQIFSGNFVQSAVSASLSFSYLFVMFYQNARLAFIVSIPILFGIIIYAFGLSLSIKKSLKIYDMQGKIYSFLVQVIRGVSKLRISGSENRIYSEWAKMFANQKKEGITVAKINVFLQISQTAISLIASLIMYYLLTNMLENAFLQKTQGMNIGSFLSFYTAFGAFISAGFVFAVNFISSMGQSIPLWKRTEVLRLEEPEIKIQKELPGTLQGSISVEHLYFRYSETGPVLLDNITMKINPAEFVAIVGPSGCGKSTLMRLLLGLEITNKGKIYYDGKDLERLDIVQVRKQIGSVMQTGVLLGGSLRDNITYGRNFSDDEIEELLNQCGFVLSDTSFPMGLNTLIPMGGDTISGGQRQQIMIARALIGKPKILILDEATSALDNKSQDLISKNIEELNITRIVVAHRLSTIINADTIYVIDQGKIVQKGTFKELQKEEKFFKTFIERQIADTLTT